MKEELAKPRFLHLLFAYLDTCKDVCDHFGITTTLVPYEQAGKVTGFTAKSYRNPDAKQIGTANVDDGEFEFGYDSFWDDGTDFDKLYSGIDDEDLQNVTDKYPTIETPVPDDDEEIISITKGWVKALMSDMGVCPFTQGAEKAGLPMGDVFYAVDRNSGFEDMYNIFWKEVVRLEQNKEADVSTTLLITPEFCFDNVELFDSFCNTLTQPLSALGIEDLLQLVFFHPVWSFRDGDARSSADGQSANYARRSPWPMINLLRTTQVRAAQKGIPTGLVYKQNEKTLGSVGVDKLETMLRLRNWDDTAEYKVDRTAIDALKLAKEFQETGKVAAKDMSLAYDTTPVAQQAGKQDEGNLVNVVLQALEKRLGKGDSGPIQPLSGPETSATAMASDLLLRRLDAIADAAENAPAEPEVSPAPVAVATKDDGTPDEVARARQERIEAAKRAVMDDFKGDPADENPMMGRGDRMSDVLFGKEGIGQTSDDDDNVFPEGMDQRSFF